MARARYFHVRSHGDWWVVEDAGGRRVYTSEGTKYDATVGADPDLRAALVLGFGNPLLEYGEQWCPPGRFFPRVYRPGGPTIPTAHRKVRDDLVHAAQIRFRALREVFQFIEPRRSNLSAFGHATRDLLMLACTEIESGWRGVLRANGYERIDARGRVVKPNKWNASDDYIHVVKPLRLNEWEVQIIGHPHLSRLRPFGAWTSAKAPDWYTAYNRVKHDREKHFPKATLGACIEALAGMFVMLYAQFGTLAAPRAIVPVPYMASNHVEGGIADMFRIPQEPAWPAGEEYASPHVAGRSEWRRKRIWG